MSARAIEFAILTACRSGEVRGARWDEIDLDAKVWTIPGERMKAGRERDDITVHGFRSTFRDWCSEAEGNNFSREVCEHALAHRLPDKVEAAYRRGDLFDKRMALMQVWFDYCHQKTA